MTKTESCTVWFNDLRGLHWPSWRNWCATKIDAFGTSHLPTPHTLIDRSIRRVIILVANRGLIPPANRHTNRPLICHRIFEFTLRQISILSHAPMILSNITTTTTYSYSNFKNKGDNVQFANYSESIFPNWNGKLMKNYSWWNVD